MFLFLAQGDAFSCLFVVTWFCSLTWLGRHGYINTESSGVVLCGFSNWISIKSGVPTQEF